MQASSKKGEGIAAREIPPQIELGALGRVHDGVVERGALGTEPGGSVGILLLQHFQQGGYFPIQRNLGCRVYSISQLFKLCLRATRQHEIAHDTAETREQHAGKDDGRHFFKQSEAGRDKAFSFHGASFQQKSGNSLLMALRGDRCCA